MDFLTSYLLRIRGASMNPYFIYITIIDLAVLLIMSIMAYSNALMGKKQRNSYILSFALIAIISIMEVITVWVDGNGLKFRWINILSNYLGFALTPWVALVLGDAIGTFWKSKAFFYILVTYDVFLALSIPFGWVFSVSKDNIYSRGEFFALYLVIYMVGIVYLFFETIHLTRIYQNRNRLLPYIIFSLLALGTSVQVINPDVHVTWLCVTNLSTIYFIYCNDLWQKVDGLTGLLNHQSYLNRINTLNKDAIFIIFDIDNFKGVNDTYGHQTGDKCLICVADCIKTVYGTHGLSFRIGGDEFAVLLFRNTQNIESLNTAFFDILSDYRKNIKELPLVSIGYTRYSKGNNIQDVIYSADKKMYQYKKCHKTNTIND